MLQFSSFLGFLSFFNSFPSFIFYFLHTLWICLFNALFMSPFTYPFISFYGISMQICCCSFSQFCFSTSTSIVAGGAAAILALASAWLWILPPQHRSHINRHYRRTHTYTLILTHTCIYIFISSLPNHLQIAFVRVATRLLGTTMADSTFTYLKWSWKLRTAFAPQTQNPYLHTYLVVHFRRALGQWRYGMAINFSLPTSTICSSACPPVPVSYCLLSCVLHCASVLFTYNAVC